MNGHGVVQQRVVFSERLEELETVTWAGDAKIRVRGSTGKVREVRGEAAYVSWGYEQNLPRAEQLDAEGWVLIEDLLPGFVPEERVEQALAIRSIERELEEFAEANIVGQVSGQRLLEVAGDTLRLHAAELLGVPPGKVQFRNLRLEDEGRAIVADGLEVSP